MIVSLYSAVGPSDCLWLHLLLVKKIPKSGQKHVFSLIDTSPIFLRTISGIQMKCLIVAFWLYNEVYK